MQNLCFIPEFYLRIASLVNSLIVIEMFMRKRLFSIIAMFMYIILTKCPVYRSLPNTHTRSLTATKTPAFQRFSSRSSFESNEDSIFDTELCGLKLVNQRTRSTI